MHACADVAIHTPHLPQLCYLDAEEDDDRDRDFLPPSAPPDLPALALRPRDLLWLLSLRDRDREPLLEERLPLDDRPLPRPLRPRPRPRPREELRLEELLL